MDSTLDVRGKEIIALDGLETNKINEALNGLCHLSHESFDSSWVCTTFGESEKQRIVEQIKRVLDNAESDKDVITVKIKSNLRKVTLPNMEPGMLCTGHVVEITVDNNRL